MSLYPNIRNREFPTLLRVCYEDNGCDMEKAADELEKLNMLLGIMRMKSLIKARDRSAKTRWSRGRNLTAIISNVLVPPHISTQEDVKKGGDE